MSYIDKNTQKTMFSSEKDYWETPRWLYEELDKEFHFTLDAAASDSNHKCDHYFTAADDGLSQDWRGEYSLCKSPVWQ